MRAVAAGAALCYGAGCTVGFVTFLNLTTASPGQTFKGAIGAAILVAAGDLLRRFGSSNR